VIKSKIRGDSYPSYERIGGKGPHSMQDDDFDLHGDDNQPLQSKSALGTPLVAKDSGKPVNRGKVSHSDS